MQNNKKLKNIVRGTVVSLCVFAGLSSISGNITKEDNNYVLMKIIDNNPKYILQEVEDYSGIDTKDDSNLVLIHAIIKNDKLDETEKNYFYELSDLICENPYIDKKKTYEQLHDLDIVYTNRPEEYDDSVLAVYSPTENTIKVFENKDNFNKEIFYHELIHAIFTNDKTINLPKFLLEGETEILTNEYLSDSPFVERTTYPFEVSIVKVLCEMAGEDEVLKAYTTGNIDSLYKKISINNNFTEGKDFINNLETVYQAFQDGEEIPVEDYNNAITYMDNFFTNKYQYDSDKMNIYDYNKKVFYLLNETNPYELYEKYIEDNGVIIKPYYSKLLKEYYHEVNRVYVEKLQQKSLKK